MALGEGEPQYHSGPHNSETVNFDFGGMSNCDFGKATNSVATLRRPYLAPNPFIFFLFYRSQRENDTTSFSGPIFKKTPG